MNGTISPVEAREMKLYLLKELVDRREYLVEDDQLADALLKHWLARPPARVA
jgi:hypothetical protein